MGTHRKHAPSKSPTPVKIPPFIPRLGKPRRITSITGKVVHFVVEDQIERPQTGYPRKMIVLQKIRFVEDGRIELRIAYYMVGEKPGARGKWVWAQYAPLIPQADFRWIIREAKRRGWL